MTIAECFAANLLRERKRAGLSQEEVGYRASLHRTEVSQLERGLRVPRADTIAKLGGALGVDPCALMEGIVWRAGKIDPGNFEISPLSTPMPQPGRDTAR